MKIFGSASSFSTLVGVTLTSAAQGDVFYQGASAVNNLAAGTAGAPLLTGGAAANPAWATSLLVTTDLVQQYRGANAQAHEWYGTRTDGTNYERLKLQMTAGTGAALTVETAGTGGDNLSLTLTPAGTGIVTLGSAINGPSVVNMFSGTTLTADGYLAVKGGVLAVGDPVGSNTGFLVEYAAQSKVIIGSAGTFGWSSSSVSTPSTLRTNMDTVLARDAADTLALKRSTNAQVFNHYGTEITAGSRYSRLAIKHATTTLSAVSGASVTATNLIPAKSNVLGVNTIVTTALGTGSGTTGYTVGDGSDADRWGAVTGTAAGTDTDQSDATADPRGWFSAANNVVITAAGGNFDGTGAIFVDVAYLTTEAD